MADKDIVYIINEILMNKMKKVALISLIPQHFDLN